MVHARFDSGFLYLSGEVCGTTLGHLQDDWGLSIASSLEGGNDGGGGGDVLSVSVCLSLDDNPISAVTHDGGDGKLVLLSVVEKLQDIIANDDTGLAGEDVLATHVCGGFCCKLRLYYCKIFCRKTERSQLLDKLLSCKRLLLFFV